MKISRVIVFSFLLLFNSTIFPQCLPVAGNIGYATPLALDAVDSNNAIISVRYSLNKTTDGGLHWVELNLPFVDFLCYHLSMVDSSHIWVVGEHEPAIFKTTNGGNTWIEQFKDTSKTEFFNYIKMFDLNNGIAVGDPKGSTKPAIFLRTTDGGSNWISTNTSNLIGEFVIDLWRKIDFINIKTGYFFPVYSFVHDNLYKTTDGGYSWGLTNYQTYANIIKFFNQDIGLAIPGGAGIERTLDGGQTWENFDVPIQGWATDICFDPNDASRVWLLEDDLFFVLIRVKPGEKRHKM